MIADDRLRLIFTCCHPALAREAQVALTLRLVCGLSTAEIAQAFVVSEPTMAAQGDAGRRRRSRRRRIAYRVPEAAELPDRLDAVLTVIHLLFTTGHTDPHGAGLVRADLVERAIDAGQAAARADAGRARGLRPAGAAADHRRPAGDQDRRARATCCCSSTRTGRSGTRTRSPRAGNWSSRRCEAGGLAGSRCRPRSRAVHAEAPSYAATDWPQLLVLYDRLLRAWPSPVVALNRAVVTSMVSGPAAALDEIEPAGAGRAARRLPLPARHQGGPAAAARPHAPRPGSPTRTRSALTENAAERAFLERPDRRDVGIAD